MRGTQPSIIFDESSNDVSADSSGNAEHLFNESQSSIRFHKTPEQIEDLLNSEEFGNVLSKSLLFIHRKHFSSERLINKLSNTGIFHSNLEFRRFQSHEEDLDTIISNIKSGLRLKIKQVIWIIELTGPLHEIGHFYTRIRKLKNDRHGIWICGHIHELDPKFIHIFDAFFVFEMSRQLFDSLRSAIPLPFDVVDRMSLQYENGEDYEPLLDFVQLYAL